MRQPAVIMNLRPPAAEVGGHAGVVTTQVLDQGAAEQLLHVPARLAGPDQRHPRHGVIIQQLALDPGLFGGDLGVGKIHSGGEQAADEGAHTGAEDDVRLQLQFLHGLEQSQVRKTAGPAAAQRHAYGAAAEHARQALEFAVAAGEQAVVDLGAGQIAPAARAAGQLADHRQFHIGLFGPRQQAAGHGIGADRLLGIHHHHDTVGLAQAALGPGAIQFIGLQQQIAIAPLLLIQPM